MEEEVTQNHRLLKVIVVTLGVLIVAMLALMVGTVIWRMKHAPAPPAPAAAAISTDLAVPPGSTVLGMTPTERELYLHLRDGEGYDHIYVLDRRNGDLLWHRRLLPTR
jgi:hypothetical protein